MSTTMMRPVECAGVTRKVKVMVDPKLEIDVITGKITEREK